MACGWLARSVKLKVLSYVQVVHHKIIDARSQRRKDFWGLSVHYWNRNVTAYQIQGRESFLSQFNALMKSIHLRHPASAKSWSGI
jgi:hypothetical protein